MQWAPWRQCFFIGFHAGGGPFFLKNHKNKIQITWIFFEIPHFGRDVFKEPKTIFCDIDGTLCEYPYATDMGDYDFDNKTFSENEDFLLWDDTIYLPRAIKEHQELCRVINALSNQDTCVQFKNLFEEIIDPWEHKEVIANLLFTRDAQISIFKFLYIPSLQLSVPDTFAAGLL